jgi:N-acetylmuramoyl-L-alanine amidase
MLRVIAMLGLCLQFIGCATRQDAAPRMGLAQAIDRTQTTVSQDSRAQFLILHFTAEDFETSMRYLTEGPVSSHYLVSDEPVPRVFQLVDESRRAFHAGVSSWGTNAAGLNAASIGIEIANLGSRVKGYADYPAMQIELVIALVRDIVKRHGIKPTHVLGHSDIAPQRKDDPGPRFPWKRLADAGLIVWPDAAKVAQLRTTFDTTLPEVAWFQQQLAVLGYAVPQSGVLDAPTQKVIAVFQMKYRPERYDGSLDAHTAALLQALSAR